jgi:hypothetical protein
VLPDDPDSEQGWKSADRWPLWSKVEGTRVNPKRNGESSLDILECPQGIKAEREVGFMYSEEV